MANETNDVAKAIIDAHWPLSAAHCAYHVGQIVLIARILAGDQWATITIPRSASAGFSQRVWGTGHYQTPKPEER